MAIPTKPKWAINDITDPVSGENNVVEPPESKKLQGWGRKEIPPRQWVNWLFKQTYLGLEWAEEQIQQLETDLTNLENIIGEGGSVSLADLIDGVDQLQIDVSALQSDLNDAETDINTLQTQVSNLNQFVQNLIDDVGQLQTDINNLIQEVNKTKKVRNTYIEEISDGAGDAIVNITEYENDEVEMYGTLEVGWKQLNNSSATVSSLAGTAQFIMSFQNMDLGMQRYSEEAGNALEIKNWALNMQITGRSVNGSPWASPNSSRHAVNLAEINNFNNRVFLQISTNFDFQNFVSGDKFIISFTAKSIKLPTS